MNRRDWIAVAVAPLWAPAWAALVEALRVRPDPILDRMGPLQVAGTAAIIGIVSAYAAMLVVGIPLHLVLKRRRWTSLLSYLLAAFAAGVVLRCVAILLSWLSFALGEGLGGGMALRQLLRAAGEQPMIFLTAGALAVLIGGTFWLLARPDVPVATGNTRRADRR